MGTFVPYNSRSEPKCLTALKSPTVVVLLGDIHFKSDPSFVQGVVQPNYLSLLHLLITMFTFIVACVCVDHVGVNCIVPVDARATRGVGSIP